MLSELLAQLVNAKPTPNGQLKCRSTGCSPATIACYQQAMQGRDWMTTREISDATGKSIEAVLSALRDRLEPHGLIEREVELTGFSCSKSHPSHWRWIPQANQAKVKK